MIDKYLITKADFGPYQEMAANIPAQRLQIFIGEAQNFDLKPFLGLAFYQALLRACSNDPTTGALIIDVSNQPYIDLVQGVTYTDQTGTQIDHNGIKQMLVYYAVSRMFQYGNFAYTATGLVKKKHDDSDPLTGKEVSTMVEENRSKAKSLENEVKKFLITKREKYPLYFVSDEGDRRRGSGSRISGVDRTNFNDPNAGSGYGGSDTWFRQL